MKWGLVAELAVPGLAIGLAVVYGLSETTMWIAWALLRLGSAVWIARALRRAHFAHGFLGGFLGAGSAVLSAAVLFGTYTANHPEFLENAAKTAPSLDPRLLLVLVAIGVGLVHGILQGTLAWIAGKIVTSR
jgi:hypothetical protein